VQPDSTSLLVTRCILARHDGRADLALRWAAAAAKLDPNDAGTQDLLAFLYSWLGDVDTGLRHAARLKELSPGSSWGLVWQIYLQVQAGNLTAAEGQVKTGAPGFKESPSFLQAKAHFHTAKGQYAEALDALVKAMPSFREAALEMEGELQFIEFPHAVFLYRQAGNEAQARGIAAAFTRTADGYYKPLEGLERGLSLSVRAEMAAVTGDRAQLIANLTQLYDTGGILPAFVLNEPWFRPYRGDPIVAEVFAKHDARRGEARRQLAADGL
jgi:tetratricopeptide (TPR) repeat protein